MARLNLSLQSEPITHHKSDVRPTAIKTPKPKSTGQSALRKINHDETLMQRIAHPIENETTTKNPETCSRSGASPVKKSVFESEPEGDDENDSLVEIDFWTKNRMLIPVIPHSLQQLSQNAETPRKARAERRQIWRRPRGGNKSVSSSSSLSPSSSHEQDSRPSSSDSNYAGATLSYEPLPKPHPIRLNEMPQPSTSPLSPTKQKLIPRMYASATSNAFWSKHLANGWNDQHSPRKASKTPRKYDSDSDTSDSVTSDSDSSDSDSSDSDTEDLICIISPVKMDKAKRAAKKLFKAKRQKLAEDFLQQLDAAITDGQVSKLAEEAGGIRLVWNNHLVTTAGQAHWRKETITTKHSDGSITKTDKHNTSIHLAEKIIDDEYRLYNTLAHEFCHLANMMVSGIKNNPHGKQFKAWGAKCTKVFGHLGVKVTTTHSYQIDYKYIWQCTACNTNYKRHSKSIKVERHRCGRCKSKLIQIQPAVRGEVGLGREKKPPSEYQALVKMHYKALRTKHSGASHGFVMRLIGDMYREKKMQKLADEELVKDKLINSLRAVSLDA